MLSNDEFFDFNSNLNSNGSSFSSAYVCPKCKMTLSDVLKSQVVGCVTCYKTFENEIKKFLLKSKGTINNVGKIPVKHFSKVKLKEKISELETKKEQAISEENFIMAESLKNQIEKLKGELEDERL